MAEQQASKNAYRRETRRLKRNYHSGSQTSLFIGDVWVDDISSLEYKTQSSKTPIYGYGSQHFDFVAAGSIIIVGSFTINFREPNYLWMILERYKRFNTLRTKSKIKEQGEQLSKVIVQDADISENDERANFDSFFSARDPQGMTKYLRDKQKILTGANDNQVKEKFNHDSFMIKVGYGVEFDTNTIGERIEGVHLTGKSKEIRIDGRPIQEAYTFIGRKNY